MKKTLLCSLAAVAAASAFGNGTAAVPGVDKIISEGKNRNQVMRHLNYLSKNIGPRLTGSPQLQRACEWTAQQFRSFGCDDVKLEKWGEMAVGFSRGARQSAKMISPVERKFDFTTPAWSPGTDGPVRGKAIQQPKTLEEFEKVKDQLKGAWVLGQARANMRFRGQEGGEAAQQLLDKINEAGIAGWVYGTNDERVHTSGRFTGLEWDKLPKVRTVIVRKSDYELASAYAQIGAPVEFEFDIENHFIKGPVPLYNVVADIRGSEKPDEVVIVCGHLDSWNGPGSQGANDNGTGVSVAMEAARILGKMGRPKRTIRFILWTGEEQGLLGSRAYVEKYKDQLKNVVAVFNDDGGSNYQGGYRCLANMKDLLDAAIAPVQKAFPHLPMQNDVIAQVESGGSSDHAPFAWEGVPAFFTKETGKADYGFVWHTQNDRPEFSVEDYLRQSSTNHAAVAWFFANNEERLPHFPKPVRGQGGSRPPMGGSRNFEPPHFHSHDDGHDHDDEFWDYFYDVLRRGAKTAFRFGRP